MIWISKRTWCWWWVMWIVGWTHDFSMSFEERSFYRNDINNISLLNTQSNTKANEHVWLSDNSSRRFKNTTHSHANIEKEIYFYLRYRIDLHLLLKITFFLSLSCWIPAAQARSWRTKAVMLFWEFYFSFFFFLSFSFALSF